MLDRIRLSNDRGDQAHIAFMRPGNNYGLIDVEGLGPPAADINYSDHTILDGAVYHNSKSQIRNLVITAEFQPDYGANQSVEGLRRALYKVATPKRPVRVQLYNDWEYEMWIEGYVETHEPSIFSKTPQVQISIIATRPHFNDRYQSNYDLNQQSNVVFDNPGDVETGFEATIFIHQSVNWVELRNSFSDPVKIIRIRTDGDDLISGRNVRINTEPGSKSIFLRDSNYTNIRRLLGETEITEGWPTILPGENSLRLNSSSSNTSATTANIRFYPKYGGF